MQKWRSITSNELSDTVVVWRLLSTNKQTLLQNWEYPPIGIGIWIYKITLITQSRRVSLEYIHDATAHRHYIQYVAQWMPAHLMHIVKTITQTLILGICWLQTSLQLNTDLCILHNGWYSHRQIPDTNDQRMTSMVAHNAAWQLCSCTSHDIHREATEVINLHATFAAFKWHYLRESVTWWLECSPTVDKINGIN